MAKTNITIIPDSELRGAYESLALENGTLRARAKRYEGLYKDSVLANCRQMWEGKALARVVSQGKVSDYLQVKHIELTGVNNRDGVIKLVADVTVLAAAGSCGYNLIDTRRVIQENRGIELTLGLDYKLKGTRFRAVSDEEFNEELKRVQRLESNLKDPRGQFIAKGSVVAYKDEYDHLTWGDVVGFDEVSATFDIAGTLRSDCDVDVKYAGDLLVISQ